MGIGGWLLFFCLQMFVLNPVVIGWQVVREIAILRANGALASRVGVMIGVDSTVRLAMVALGFVCGVLLWTRHSQAVAAARAFLVVVVVGYLLLVSLPFVFSLPGTARMHVAGIYMYRAGMAVPGMIFWLLYFKHSRRVRATYGSGRSIQAAA